MNGSVRRPALLRLSVAGIGVIVLLAVVTQTVLAIVGADRATLGAPEVWVEDVEAAISLSDEEAEKVLAAVRSALASAGSGEIDAGSIPPGPATPHVVLLSASDGQARAKVGVGAGHGFAAALGNAVAALRGLGVTGKAAGWLRLDIVRGHDERPRDAAGHPLPLPLPREGVAFSRGTGLALLTPEVAAYGALRADGGIRISRLPRLLQLRVASLWRVALAAVAPPEREVLDRLNPIPFAADTFFSIDRNTLRLIGTQRARDVTDPNTVAQAAKDAGTYLQRMTLADGRFVYSYLPGSDEAAPGYNLLRHAGTTYAMLELYQLTRNPTLLTDAERAIDYLLGHVRDGPDADTAFLVSERSIKLGGVALTIIMLAKHAEVTGDRRHLPRMQALGRYIRESQGDDGAFVQMRALPDLEPQTNFDSRYYPGEAILALLRLHALDPQDQWLDTAERGARFLITVRDAGVAEEQLGHDHWLLYGLNELYRLRPDRLYLDHASRIARAIAGSQNRNPYPPDRLGTFVGRAESTPAATRTEGLIAAYALARDFGQREDLFWLRAAIELGVGFQLETQFLPERAMYFPHPDRALGGFHQGLTDYEIRIDYVQHNLSAILGLYRLLTEPSAVTADRR